MGARRRERRPARRVRPDRLLLRAPGARAPLDPPQNPTEPPRDRLGEHRRSGPTIDSPAPLVSGCKGPGFPQPPCVGPTSSQASRPWAEDGSSGAGALAGRCPDSEAGAHRWPTTQGNPPAGSVRPEQASKEKLSQCSRSGALLQVAGPMASPTGPRGDRHKCAWLHHPQHLPVPRPGVLTGSRRLAE